MASQKTQPGAADPRAYLETVAPDRRRADALRLLELFGEVTGYPPVLWGGTMVGFGRYAYTYKSGHSGQSLATGFAPRKANMSIYIMPGYAEFGEILGRLGTHKMGKACLYITRLDQIDEAVLAELIRAGLADLGARWTIHPS